MKKYKDRWFGLLPTLSIGAIILFLGITNYTPNTYLTGGDNLHPEFNLLLNIKRSIVATWQEYRGLGLLGGMGHAADLFYNLFLLPLSFVFPEHFLRYFMTLLTLLSGTIGAYYLIRKILLSSRGGGATRDLEDPGRKTMGLLANARSDKENPHTRRYTPIALLGAFFYLLNLGTLQMYYTPFEVFSMHFALLPWLFLTTINFFQKPTKKHLLLLALTLLLATPAYYVPTLFIVWLMATSILTLFLTIKTKPFVMSHKSLVKYFALVFAINAFWLLPFAYFTFTNSQVNVTAKINQMATEQIFLLNKEFGDITDVMLLKGFLLNTTDTNRAGNFHYMLGPWRTHLQDPFILGIGYAFFAVITGGLIHGFKSRSRLLLACGTIFLLAFSMLVTATPPFSVLNDFLRTHVPLFNQIFRFPFTKFSVLLSLMYAIFFAIGLQMILTWLSQKVTKHVLPPLSFSIISLMLILFSLPVFQGNLFYDKAQLSLPREYKELFSYFDTQDPHTRIATFPQHTFWSWYFYNWGYSGSGFLWYGLSQPTLDRAFDVWGSTNENYYFEVSQAVYAKNLTQLENVLQKYHASHIILDRNIIYPSSPTSLFYTELTDMLSQIPSVRKSADFGTISVYKVSLKDKPEKFVSMIGMLPSVNTTSWNNTDLAYEKFGNYISTDDTREMTNGSFYPFRSLFTNKTAKEQQFVLEERESTLIFRQSIPPLSETLTLHIPAFSETENSVPVILLQKDLGNNTHELLARIKTPDILLNGEKIAGETYELPLFTLPASEEALTLSVNSVIRIPVAKTQSEIGTTSFSLKADNTLLILDEQGATRSQIVIPATTLRDLSILQQKDIQVLPHETEQEFAIHVPKITDSYLHYTNTLASEPEVKNCEAFRHGEIHSAMIEDAIHVQAQNATACLAFYSPNLPHSEGYTIVIKAQNLKGLGWHFWVLNENAKSTPIDTFLSPDGTIDTHTFILPPQDTSGKAFSFHLDNIAIGKEETANSLDSITAYQIPYRFLTEIAGSPISSSNEAQSDTRHQALSVNHPNESLYDVTLRNNTSGTLILSQSYDPGWTLYRTQNHESGIRNVLATAFPFFAGEKINTHVMINNWANGWILDDQSPGDPNQRFVIVYLPQYLQYGGFVILSGTILFLAFYALGRRST